ncbi:MAG: hypothetical protein OXC07_01270 [Kistimonas sp.]|nr:hypothetical protein [Kistimonas sp.]
MQKKPRLRELLAKDPAALALMAKAARGGSNQKQVLHLLRETLLTYTGKRRDSAKTLADEMYAKQKKIAELKEEWTKIKAYMMSHANDYFAGRKGNDGYGCMVYKEFYKKSYQNSWLDDFLSHHYYTFTDLLNKVVEGLDLPPFDSNQPGGGHNTGGYKLIQRLFPHMGSNFESQHGALGASADYYYGWLVREEHILAADARIESACAQEQAKLDAKNKELKNEMTQVSSVGEELRDLSREITSLGKGF